MDWAAYPKHLQTVFREFDAIVMISKPVLICLFRDGLKPSIGAQTKQKGRQKDTWDQAIKKAITIEAKAALNLPLWVREMDACCPWGHRSTSKPTKDHTRDQGSLLFRLKEAETISLHCSERAKTLETPCWDH